MTQEEDVEEEVEGSMTSDSGGKMPSVEIGEKTFPMIQSCSSISGNTPFSLSTTSETILFPQTPQSVSKTISDDTNGNVELLMSLSPSIPSLNNNALTTKSPCSSNAEIAPKHSLLTMEEPTQNKEISTSDISVSDHEKRLIKIYQFLTSYKFVVLIYIISLIFSTCLWLLMGGIEEGIYVSQHGTKPKIFTFAGFLEFKLGCTLTTNCLILILSLAMVYCLFEAIAIILSIRADRDTWQIKKENFVVLIVEVIGLACFIILGLVPQVQSLIDFLVPYGLILFFSFSVESIISVLMPAIYEIRNDWLKDWKRQKHEDEHVDSYVEQLLKTPKTFKILLDHARRSYCPEGVLCYHEIQRYKKTKKEMTRKKIAMYIIETFLTLGAPLEINISLLEQRREALLKQIDVMFSKSNNSVDFNDISQVELFHDIEIHCVNDLTDLMGRLKDAKEFIQEKEGIFA